MDPNLSPTDMPATPHCHVLRLRLGLFWGGFLLASGVGFTALLVGGILWGSLGPVWGGGIAGGGLLLLATGIALVRRATAPMLAVLTDDTLRLEPRGRGVGYGHAPTAYPLADLTSYSLMTSPNGAQVTLETSGGAKLQLWPRFSWALRTAAERAADAALPDVVDLDTFGPELLRRMELHQAALPALAPTDAPRPALEQPGFFQGKLARALSWLCYAGLAAGVVLLFVPGVEWGVSLELISAAVVYLGTYWSNQDSPAAAAPAE